MLVVTSGGGNKNVIIGFGGHLAREFTWGTNKGSSDFPGGSGKVYGSFDGSSDDNASPNPGQVVQDVNDPPVAVNDSATTDEDTFIDIPVIANDADVDTANGSLVVALGSIGNVVGGILFGIGWSITGMCPGPVLVNIGEGKMYAIAALAGLIISAAVWALSSHAGNYHHAGMGKRGTLISAGAALLDRVVEMTFLELRSVPAEVEEMVGDEREPVGAARQVHFVSGPALEPGITEIVSERHLLGDELSRGQRGTGRMEVGGRAHR